MCGLKAFRVKVLRTKGSLRLKHLGSKDFLGYRILGVKESRAKGF